MTIPNLLTIGRIFLTPVLLWLVLERRLTAAMCVFFVAGMTDALDGFIARYFNQKSRLGAYMDPLADKMLLVSSFIVLCQIGLIPLWLVIITVARDIMILSGVFFLYFSGVSVEMKPLTAGKATTFFQLSTVFLALGSDLIPFPQWTYASLFVTTAALTIYSGVRYFCVGRLLFETHKSRESRS
jgi:cardiolipin synthase